MHFLENDKKVVAELAGSLSNKNYSFVSGGQIAKIVDAKEKEVFEFKRHWDYLVRDRYMADGGQYRYRRYGQFSKLAKEGLNNYRYSSTLT